MDLLTAIVLLSVVGIVVGVIGEVVAARLDKKSHENMLREMNEQETLWWKENVTKEDKER